MKMTEKSQFLAIGVRRARKKRDLLARKKPNGTRVALDSYLYRVGAQDDVVEAHLRQFKQSLINTNQ